MTWPFGKWLGRWSSRQGPRKKEARLDLRPDGQCCLSSCGEALGHWQELCYSKAPPRRGLSLCVVADANPYFFALAKASFSSSRLATTRLLISAAASTF